MGSGTSECWRALTSTEHLNSPGNPGILDLPSTRTETGPHQLWQKPPPPLLPHPQLLRQLPCRPHDNLKEGRDLLVQVLLKLLRREGLVDWKRHLWWPWWRKGRGRGRGASRHGAAIRGGWSWGPWGTWGSGQQSHPRRWLG